MTSSHPANRRDDDEAPSEAAEDQQADSLGGGEFTDEMHDGEGQADDRIGARTAPDDGGSGRR